MTATAPKTRPLSAGDASILDSVNRLEALLNRGADCLADDECFESLGEEMRLLHARLRAHHAVDQLAAARGTTEIPAEYSDQIDRLCAEHTEMIGDLDRLIRRVSSMRERPAEDREVFLLRSRELIATIRRHEAEEDRLFYLAVWRDTGGES